MSRCRARGFTLLEVVVAIALFALLMTLVYGAFGTAVRAHDAGRQRTDEGSSMRVVSEFLRNSIASAAPVAVTSDNEWAVLFEGSEGRLHYVSDLPGHVGDGGLHEIVIESEREGDSSRLMMRRRPLSLDEDGVPVGEYTSRVLLPETEALSLRFFGNREDDEGEAPRWHADWVDSRRPPLLVELGIRPAGSEAWPVLRVHPRGDSVRYLGAQPRQGRAPAGQQPESAAPQEQPPAAAPAPGQVLR